MMDAGLKGLLLSGFAYPGHVGGRSAGRNAAIRSQRARRKMAERERRAAAKAFATRTGIELPPELDGRGYDEADFDKLAAFIDANPAAKVLVERFSDIDAEWHVAG